MSLSIGYFEMDIAEDETSVDAGGEGVSDRQVELWTGRMVAGDLTAFNAFMAVFSDPVHRYCLVSVRGDWEASYELHQEVLIRIARYPRAIGDVASLWKWMKRIVRTALIDQVRRQQRYGKLVTHYLDEWAGRAVEARDAASSLRESMMDALDHLGEGEQDLLRKKYLEGWSYQAIAEDYGISAKAVESRITRARESLRVQVEVLLRK